MRGKGSDDSILLEFSEKLLQILEMIKETEGRLLKKEETFNLFAAYITYYDINKNEEPLGEDNLEDLINIVGSKYKSKLNPKAKESGGKRNKRRTQKRNGNKRRNNNSRKQKRNNNSRKQKRNVSKKNNKSRKQNRR